MVKGRAPMSFFRKLKDRMLRSSSKIDEGLDAIIEEGAVEEEGPAQTVDPTPGPAPSPEASPEPDPTPGHDPAPDAPTTPPPGQAPIRVEDIAPPSAETPAPAAKPGLFGRLMGRTSEPRRALDDAMLEQLEELLISADMGVDTALRVTANMAEGRYARLMSVSVYQGLALCRDRPA